MPIIDQISTVFFFLRMRLRPIVGQPGNSSIISRVKLGHWDKPPFSLVRGQDSTMWDIIWASLQGHRSVSVRRRVFLQAPQCPWPVWKRFRRDHCCRGGGRWEDCPPSGHWPPELTSRIPSIDFWLYTTVLNNGQLCQFVSLCVYGDVLFCRTDCRPRPHNCHTSDSFVELHFHLNDLWATLKRLLYLKICLI